MEGLSIILEFYYKYNLFTYSNKDVTEDTKYYPQVLLEQCRYTSFVNNKLIHDVLDFA